MAVEVKTDVGNTNQSKEKQRTLLWNFNDIANKNWMIRDASISITIETIGNFQFSTDAPSSMIKNGKKKLKSLFVTMMATQRQMSIPSKNEPICQNHKTEEQRTSLKRVNEMKTV